MSPKVPGRDYYRQDAPSKRGYKGKTLPLHEDDAALFDADAKEAGCSSAGEYIRKLWNADRAARGLPPVEPRRKA